MDRIVEAYPGDIANTMWSFAAYGHKKSRLVDAIVERPEVMQKIAGGREVDVSRTVFALQKLEGKVPMLLKEALRDKKAKRKKKKLMTGEERQTFSLLKQVAELGECSHKYKLSSFIMQRDPPTSPSNREAPQ